MAKAGRHSIRTTEIEDKIIEGLSAGIPLTEICAAEDMPGVRTVYDWMEADEAISAAFSRARSMGYDAISVEALRIADDGTNDYVTRTGKDGKEFEAFDAEHVQRSKLRVETRLKLLAKWDPKRYGDRIDVTSGGEKLQREIGEVERFSRLAALAQRHQGLLPDFSGEDDE